VPDEDHLSEISYSSGESDEETRHAYIRMTDEERAERVAHLWRRALAKTRGAVQVILTFGDLNRRIFLYGSSKKNEELDLQEQIKPLPFILMPDSQILSAWNIVMMLLLLYTATYVPFKTAFVENSSDLVNNIEFSIDSLFFLDLIVNFISAYETADKNVEFRLSQIAFTYLRTWFIFDVFSCIPF
jgi:Ion transport protein